jgi:hypothetical protein
MCQSTATGSVSTWVTPLLFAASAFFVAVPQEAVVLWEELRPKQTTKEQKQQLVAQIVKKVCWLTCLACLLDLPSLSMAEVARR